MSKFTIIEGTSKIKDALKKLRTVKTQYRRLLHTLAVSTLVHANKHGDVTPLNTFVEELVPNEVTALRNYVSRFQTRKNDKGETVPTNMAFLKFENKKFAIDKTAPQENRGADSLFVKHAKDKLINPDGKSFKFFYDQDNVQDAFNLFDDKNIVQSLEGMLKRANGERERVVSKVSDQFKKLVADAVAQAHKIAEGVDLDAIRKRNELEVRALSHQSPANIEKAIAKRSDAKARPANGRRKAKANKAAQQQLAA